jgi:thymidylate synthase
MRKKEKEKRMINIFLESRDLPDLWFQTIYSILENGRLYTINRGSYAGQKRLEFDHFSALIKYPGTQPLLPQIPEHYNIPNPVSDDYLYGTGEKNQRGYLEYIMSPTILPNESYTYGSRLTQFPIEYPIENFNTNEFQYILIHEMNELINQKIVKIIDGKYYLNQIEFIIWCYREKGFNNNQMILQVAKPDDILIQDPPCLRDIQCKIINNKLVFYVNFRSWEIHNGLPANLAAIQLMKEYMADSIEVEDGEMYIMSKGAHLYDYSFDVAKCLRNVKETQFKIMEHNKK